MENIFEDYMDNMFKNAKKKNIEVYLKEVPVHFNDFVLSSMGRRINGSLYPFVCQFLLELGNWMTNEGLTELEIEYIGFGH